MTHSRRNKARYGTLNVQKLSLSDVEIEETAIPTAILAGAAGTLTDALVQVMTVTMADLSLTVDGTGGEGFVGSALFTLPATRILILGAFADFEITGVGAGAEIDADALVGLAVGTTTTVAGAMTTTEADIIGETAMQLAAGVKASTEAVMADDLTTAVDAAGGASLFLNMNVADADITATDTGTVDVTATIRILYVDISSGD